MGKISRSVAKTKAATAKAALKGESDDEAEDFTKEAKREAAEREEALSSLLVSTFAGAELAQRLPLDYGQECDVSVFGCGGNLSHYLELCRWMVSFYHVHTRFLKSPLLVIR